MIRSALLKLKDRQTGTPSYRDAWKHLKKQFSSQKGLGADQPSNGRTESHLAPPNTTDKDRNPDEDDDAYNHSDKLETVGKAEICERG